MAAASILPGLLQPRHRVRSSATARAGIGEAGARRAISWSEETVDGAPAALTRSIPFATLGGDDWTRSVSAGAADVSRQFQFDGSGSDDILLRSFDSGTGAFAIWASNSNYYLAANPSPDSRPFAVGDVNADGLADLLWVTPSRIWLQRTITAAGGVPNTSGTPLSIVGASQNQAFLAAADINGDGRVDLLKRQLVTGEVFMRLSSVGVFGVGSLTSISAGPLSHAWMLGGTGDLNNDGREDLLWRHTDGTVLAWLMNANGTFTSSVLTSVGHEWRLETIARLVPGDTGSDILWRNVETGQGLVWSMSTTGAFRIAAAVPYGPIDSDRTFYQVQHGLPAGVNPGSIQAVIWHRNDHLMRTSMRPDGSAGSEARLRYNQGTYAGLQPLSQQAFDFQSRDFNTLGGYLRTLRTHQYGTVGPAAGNTGRVGLLNGVTGSYEVLYLSGGSLQLFAPVAAGGSTPFTPDVNFIPVGFADLNGDGRSIDLFGWLGSALVHYLWNGSAYNPVYSVPASTLLSLIGVGNIDGIAGDELLFHDADTTSILYLRFSSEGFVSNSDYVGAASPSLVAHGCADLNGDGRDDLVFRDNVTGAVSYWTFDASRRRTGTSVINTTPVTTAWDLVGFANIDGDGDDDIIWRRNSDGFTVAWVMESGGLGSVAGLAVLNWDWRLEGTSDMNGDGTTDLVWRNASGQFAAWMMNNAAIASVATSATLGFDRMSLGFTGAITRAA